MQVNKVAVQLSSTEVELSCLTGCTPSAHPAYVWLKNEERTGQVTARYRGYLQPGDGVSCALRGHEVYGSPAVCELAASSLSGLCTFSCSLPNSGFSTLLPPDAPKFPSVSFSPPGDIIEDTQVTLTCSSDAHIAASHSWLKGNSSPRQIKSGSDLVFSSIRSSDSGHYHCAARNQLGIRMTQHVIDVKCTGSISQKHKSFTGTYFTMQT